MKNSKTVAIVINTSWNIYNFRVGLLKALQEEGYRIVAIAPKDNFSHKLEELGFEYHDIAMNNKGTNPFEDLRLVYDYYRLFAKIRPDVSLHYTIKPNIYGTFAARLAGVPVLNNISGLGTVFIDNNMTSKIAKKLYRFALFFSKKVFFQNEHDRELFIINRLVNPAKTAVLPGSGIDIHKEIPLHHSVQKEGVCFLFIARLIKDKGLVEFVEAARIIKAKYPSSDFAVLGPFYEGNPSAVTEDEVEAWEEEGVLRYLGVSDDVEHIIVHADCVVLPSYREGMSRVLLEASLMAKPIITTDVPGCRELVDDGFNGFLCDAKDSIDLAEKMELMLLLEDIERINMGIHGRQKVVNEFNEEIVIDKYRDAITEVLS
jgi:glycosyltransferase involved in cell wall biosynthesis